MELIGPPRIHHSPFASLTHSQVQPRTTRQMLATLHPAAASSDGNTRGGSNGGTVSRSQGGGRSSKRGRERGAACLPKLERGEEDKRQPGNIHQQQLRGASAEGKHTHVQESGAGDVVPGRVVAGSTATTVTTATKTTLPGKGREARGSASGADHRRPSRQRRWNKSGQSDNNAVHNSHNSSPRARANRQRKTNYERVPSNEENNHKQQQQQQRQVTAIVTTEVDPKPKSKAGGRANGKRKQSTKRSRGTRPMSSIDSGKGEDLSSSCESSVFDPPQPSSLTESRGHRSRCSSCSSLEFHDALSHPASDDDGVNSSAYVTPSTTRPHSPHPHHDNCRVVKQNSVLSSESSIDRLCLSLNQLSNDRQEDAGLGESHDCHVTQPTTDRVAQETARTIESEIDSISPCSESRVPPMNDIIVGGAVLPMNDVIVGGAEMTLPLEGANGVCEKEGESSDDDACVTHSDTAQNSHALLSSSRVEPHSTHSSPLTVMATPTVRLPGSSSTSDASPQSSECSHSTRPLTPPSSTPSQSPAPSTPSQLSPSPSSAPLRPAVAKDTVATDMVAQLRVDNRLPYKTDQSRSSRAGGNETTPQKDEWPDLHSFSTDEVKVQIAGTRPPDDITQYPLTINERGRGEMSPLYTSSTTSNGEVRVHPMEPPPQNGAAAYPHMGHPTPYHMPYPWMGPQGPYFYCNYNYPSGGYYPAPGPHVMWQPAHPPPMMNAPPSHTPPMCTQGGYHENGHTPLDETPPTAVGAGSSDGELDRPSSSEREEEMGGEGEKEIEGEREGEGEREREDSDEGSERASGDEDAIETSEEIVEQGGESSAIVPTHHPLETTWAMWYDKITGTTRNRSIDYRSQLQHLITVSSVEDFWRLYNNIYQPSHLDRNSNYHFFKEGIEPMWEDEANKEGGKWVLTMRDGETLLDKTWEELLLAMIGGVIHNCHAVNGAVVSRRKKGDRVALWTSDKSVNINLDICADLLKVLVIACEIPTEEIPDFISQLAEGRDGLTLMYMYHNDSLKTRTSYQNKSHIHLRENCEELIAKVLEKLAHQH